MMKHSSPHFCLVIAFFMAFAHGLKSQDPDHQDLSEWNIQTGLTTATLEDVNFWDNGIGCAIGKGTVLRTEDGGSNWMVIPAEPILEAISFSFPDEDTAYVLGEYYNVMKSIDGGHTWFDLPGNKNSRALIWTELFMTDATHGLEIGFFISPGGILSDAARKMEDGTNWDFCCDQLEGMLTKVRFQDEMRGFVTSMDNDTWLTGNGAVSFWEPSTDMLRPVQDVYFISQSTGYMIMSDDEGVPPARAVMKSTDQGLNWSTVFLDTTGNDSRLFRRVWFQDEMNGYIVGDGGLITRTRDGGYSWNTEESGTPYDFVDAYFLDTNNAVLVGENGIIARKGLVFPNSIDIKPPVETFRIYPNPCHDGAYLTFKLQNACRIRIQVKDSRNVTVVDICDRVFPTGENQVYVNTSSLAPGLYIMHYTGGEKPWASKLIVNSARTH